MQAVKGHDWGIIQSLYLQGLSPKQIEAETGVKAGQVSVRATRKGWTKLLAKSKPILQAAMVQQDGDEPEVSSLSKRSEAVRSGLADVLMRSVEKIQAMTLPSPKAALKANQELESVVRNAKAVFGWSEGQSQPSVRINVLGSVQVHSGSGTGSNAVPAIEQDNAKAIALETVQVQVPD